jgi:paraquat-inducible protein B
MTEAPNDATTPDALPAAMIRRRRRWTVYVVWLVPLIAAVVAGVLVYNRITEYGPTVTLMFRDATGLKPRQSEVRYRGVAVGEVSALELSPDLAYVVVTARACVERPPTSRARGRSSGSSARRSASRRCAA